MASQVAVAFKVQLEDWVSIEVNTGNHVSGYFPVRIGIRFLLVEWHKVASLRKR